MTVVRDLLEAVAIVARIAADEAMRHYRGNIVVESKADGSPVTIADRRAEQAARDWVEANREKLTRLYPLRRLGQSDDVAPMVALLASPRSSWITGQVVSISGGFSMV